MILLFLNAWTQTFYISQVRISQKVKGDLMWDSQHIISIWRRRYWQIFKSTLKYLLWNYLTVIIVLQIFKGRKCSESRKKFLGLLNKKSRELNVTKIWKSEYCWNLKSRLAGRKKNPSKKQLNKNLAIHYHNSKNT